MSEFVLNPALSVKAQAFISQEQLIADIVLPKTPVEAEVFRSDYFPVGVFTQTRDNRVGRADSPKIINIKSQTRNFETEDFSLDSIVYRYDTERNIQGLKTKTTSIKFKEAHVLALASAQKNSREARVARKVQDIQNFVAGNSVVLAGPSRWSDPTSRPLDDIMRAIDNSLVPYNLFVMGSGAFNALKVHPQIVSAVWKNAGRDGIVDQASIEMLLGGPKIVVGKAFISAYPEFDPTRTAGMLKRAWGNHASLLFVDPSVQAIAGLGQYTFGYTPQVGGTRIMEMFNPLMGARGADIIRILDIETELLMARFCGFLFKDVVAASAILSIDNLM